MPVKEWKRRHSGWNEVTGPKTALVQCHILSGATAYPVWWGGIDMLRFVLLFFLNIYHKICVFTSPRWFSFSSWSAVLKYQLFLQAEFVPRHRSLNFTINPAGLRGIKLSLCSNPREQWKANIQSFLWDLYRRQRNLYRKKLDSLMKFFVSLNNLWLSLHHHWNSTLTSSFHHLIRVWYQGWTVCDLQLFYMNLRLSMKSILLLCQSTHKIYSYYSEIKTLQTL